jgi:UDP-hydrolysing UDP-N-acetyl-D-glucosamine 2-epimerase
MSVKKPKILIVTGTRAEFGILTPVIHAIRESKKLNLQLLVTGMHLQKQFGYTLTTVRALGGPIAATVPMYKQTDTPAQSLARGTANLAKAFQKLKPHLVMVLGDRLEILAAANAALACQVPLAHLHGGETAPGQWDEQIRHAITKIAHLHFPATKKAAQRILQMGEHPTTIHTVGAPALDSALAHSLAWKRKAATTNPAQSRAILLLHPSAPNDQIERRRAIMLTLALRRTLRNTHLTILGPNNDPGHQGILDGYRIATRVRGTGSVRFEFKMSLTQPEFFHLLATSQLLIGNSSAGILEAATFGVPVINLGDRQKGRERNPNVIDVPWEAGPGGIQTAIKKATSPSYQRLIAKRKNLYGDGHASERILKTLESLKFPLPTTKQFHDH